MGREVVDEVTSTFRLVVLRGPCRHFAKPRCLLEFTALDVFKGFVLDDLAVVVGSILFELMVVGKNVVVVFQLRK